MGAATIADEYRSLSRQPPTDPDIQATLSDYLTYTEHFPSHLTRALTLIREQTRRTEDQIASVHSDTTAYALLPTLPKENRPDPIALRRNISYALEEAERACHMRVEEAKRLEEMALREAKRLDIVVDKLKAQPMPPSRDPTPEQQPGALTSPNLKREGRPGTRSDDVAGADKKPSRRLDKAASKLRGRKIMVPGEVLPPPDPNAPVESLSDWTSPRVSPPVEEAPVHLHLQKPTTPRPRSRTPKVPKQEKQRRKDMSEELQRTPKSRGPRVPGQPGTNAHSAVAGISTSNALLALKPPPEGVGKGSIWLPWMRLTEWEMAKLRKRMKKNAIWIPSQTMVRRELKNLGRGVGGRDAARQAADAGGPPFLDEVQENDPTKIEVSGEDQATMTAMLGPAAYTDGDDDADAELINRGMRLNEAKKLKRARLLEEQKEAAAQIAREQAIEPPVVDSRAGVAADHKKRKRDTTPAAHPLDGPVDTPDPLTKPGPPLKKLKIAPPAPIATGSKVPLAPAGVTSSPRTGASRSQRRAETPPPVKKPMLILKASKAVSEEPPNRRASLRRGSNASLPSGSGGATGLDSPGRAAAAAPKNPRRSKRPAPGVITNGDPESAKVGVSRRKSAPRKKNTTTPAAQKATSTPTTISTTTALPPLLPALAPDLDDELIDPSEPRYCVCGDVSWGTMIACDNEENCEKEWFHLSCVGLEDLPPRRTKWYCPDCRKRLKVGGSTGLVGRVGSATGAGAVAGTAGGRQ